MLTATKCYTNAEFDMFDKISILGLEQKTTIKLRFTPPNTQPIEDEDKENKKEPKSNN